MMAPEMRFDGRVAVVTGGGTGIGRAHCLLLGARGASVVVNDLDGDAAAAVASEIAASGGAASAVASSVAEIDGAAEVIDTALDRFGGCDIVVANAGILRSAPFAELDVDTWDLVQSVNLRGTFLVLKAAWSHMTDAGYGRIVATTSNSGLLGIPGSAAYAAAKAGVWGLVRTLSIEGADLGIRVNGIAPMAFTAMSKQSKNAPESWRSGEGDAWSARLDPAFVAAVAALLAHETCPLTGEVLSAVGGRVARFFMGLTEGVVDDALTPEFVRDHLAEILETEEFAVLPKAFDEGRAVHRRVMR